MTEPKARAEHIGIVGCSAEGAALCYRTVCASGAALMGPYGHPEVSLHTPSFAAYVDCLGRGDWAGVADLMLGSAEKLARIGADFLICPDNTIHEALPLVLPRSPLPWLHIAKVVADEAVRRGFRRLGLTGTRWLVAGPVYAEAFAARGLELVRPAEVEREEVNRIIMDELVHGEFRQESIVYFQKLIRRMKEDGCDAVVLGCTEIPLIIYDANSSLADARLDPAARQGCGAAGGGERVARGSSRRRSLRGPRELSPPPVPRPQRSLSLCGCDRAPRL